MKLGITWHTLAHLQPGESGIFFTKQSVGLSYRYVRLLANLNVTDAHHHMTRPHPRAVHPAFAVLQTISSSNHTATSTMFKRATRRPWQLEILSSHTLIENLTTLGWSFKVKACSTIRKSTSSLQVQSTIITFYSSPSIRWVSHLWTTGPTVKR